MTVSSTLVNTVSLPELTVNETSMTAAHREDLEVEEILNDIGIFAEGDFGDPMGAMPSHMSRNSVLPAMTATSSSLAPVSPDHRGYASSSPMPTALAPDQAENLNEGSPSSSAENLKTFSVPNPMAAIAPAPVPNPMAPAPAPAMATVTPPIAPKATHVPSPLPVPVVARSISSVAAPAPKAKATIKRSSPGAKAKKASAGAKPATANRKRKLSTPNVTSTNPNTAALAKNFNKARLARSNSTVSTGSSSIASSKSATLNPLEDPDGILTEEQMEERRQRNREHAKRSRQRKKSLTSTLQQAVEEIKAENAEIRRLLEERLGRPAVEASLEARKEIGRQTFLQGLRQPANKDQQAHKS